MCSIQYMVKYTVEIMNNIDIYENIVTFVHILFIFYPLNHGRFTPRSFIYNWCILLIGCMNVIRLGN